MIEIDGSPLQSNSLHLTISNWSSDMENQPSAILAHSPDTNEFRLIDRYRRAADDLSVGQSISSTIRCYANR